MADIEIPRDSDKDELAARYVWANNRLGEIINTPFSNASQVASALKDVARVQRYILRIAKRRWWKE